MKAVILKRQYQLFNFLIIISFLGDISRKIALYNDFNFIRQSTLSKLIFVVVGIIFLILRQKDIFLTPIKKEFTIAFIGLILLFIIGQYFSNNVLLIGLYNVEFLGKYLFFPFLLILFFELRESSFYISRLLQLIEIVFFINALFLLIGYTFQIEVFKTYIDGSRFGYKGIFSNSGQTGFYFILMMFYYTHQLVFKKYNRQTVLKLIFIIIVSLLIGTKRIYFFLPIYLLYYLFFLGGYKNKLTLKVGVVFIIIFLFLHKEILLIFNDFIELFYNIYINNGWISSFTSFRSNLLTLILENRMENNFMWIFGGLDFSKGRSELGFIDLWLFFGILGLVFYLYFYKVLFSFKLKNHFYWFFIISIGTIAFFADSFFLETNVPILLFLICSYFYLYEKQEIFD